MNKTSSRAPDLWKRFVGMFGGEAVRRKFGDTPPPEWVGVIAQLTDYQLERGMRRLLASGKAGVPSLPEFRRLCVAVADDELDVPESAGALPAPEWLGDEWDRLSNLRLLECILVAGSNKRYYAAEPTGCLVTWKKAWARDCREQAPDAATQDRWWTECMARAEAEITELRAPA